MDFGYLINLLNTNSGAVQAVATILLVAITIYYAWQTKRNVQVLEKTAEEGQRPKVAIYIKQREDWLNLVDLTIGNYGNGVARDIKFTVNNDIKLIRDGESLRNIEIIRNGLPTLAPQQEMTIPLLSLVGRVDELQKEDTNISIEYKDHSLNKTYQNIYLISFKSLLERQLGTPPIYEIAKNTEGIKKSLEKISKNIERTVSKG